MLKTLRVALFPAQIQATANHHLEKLISGLGALVAIYAIATVNSWLIPGLGTPLVLTSMGASAVLLFATPHSPLTQPWPLLGGQFFCAVIGVTCAMQIPAAPVAAAVAVGLAVFVMYYLRCLHPPGGATALAAVVGGPALHDLGYAYVIVPVMLDTCIIVAVGMLFNCLFPWRRYPAVLVRHRDKVEQMADAGEEMRSPISADDIRHAVDEMESFIDVSERDLAEIYHLALRHAESARMTPEQITLGKFYSNGRTDSDWAVRRVIDESGVSLPGKDRIIYRISAGRNANTTGTCTRADFAHWAKYAVRLAEGRWVRVEADPQGTDGGSPT
jgi:CBS-domain-containing membrane protein